MKSLLWPFHTVPAHTSLDTVDTLVSEEVGAPTEGLLALLTLVWLLSSVDSLVDGELRVLAERLRTLPALIRLLSNVNLLVKQQL